MCILRPSKRLCIQTAPYLYGYDQLPKLQCLLLASSVLAYYGCTVDCTGMLCCFIAGPVALRVMTFNMLAPCYFRLEGGSRLEADFPALYRQWYTCLYRSVWWVLYLRILFCIVSDMPVCTVLYGQCHGCLYRSVWSVLYLFVPFCIVNGIPVCTVVYGQWYTCVYRSILSVLYLFVYRSA